MIGYNAFRLTTFCYNLENTNKKQFFVSHINSNSLVNAVDNIENGDYLEKINGKEIKSIKDIKLELDKMIKKKSSLLIETTSGMFYLEYKEILVEEQKMLNAGLQSYILNNIKK